MTVDLLARAPLRGSRFGPLRRGRFDWKGLPAGSYDLLVRTNSGLVGVLTVLTTRGVPCEATLEAGLRVGRPLPVEVMTVEMPLAVLMVCKRKISTLVRAGNHLSFACRKE